MNVLFYLQPRIELKDPYFRFPTLRNHIIPQIESLKQSGWNTHLVIGNGVYEKGLGLGYLNSLGSYSVVDDDKLRDIMPDYKTSAKYWLDSKDGDNLISGTSDYIQKGIPADFTPDMIICWETPAEFFRLMYPSATLIYQWPGNLSRAPFPEMITFDTGILGRSIQNKYTQDIEYPKLPEYLRKEYLSLFKDCNPLKKRITIWKNKFKKLILLPLQVDDYFMVSEVIGTNISQFEKLIYILGKMPKDVGVIITQYNSRTISSKVITEENRRYLSKQFSNFIFEDSFDQITGISQFLTIEVDGVIAISSAIGFQAALWQKPLYLLGESHLTGLESANSLEELLLQVFDNKLNNKDSIIEHNLSRHQPCFNYLIRKKGRLTSYLNAIRNNDLKSGAEKTNNLWLQYEPVEQIIDRYKRYQRKNNYLKEVGFFEMAKTEPYLGVCLELSNQIDRHKIISFDIFDTLLYRPFSSPSDLFDLMDEQVSFVLNEKTTGFKNIRKAAEKKAFEKSITNGIKEITIEEIYDNVGELLQISDTQTKDLLNIEIELEKELLYPRKAGVNAFNEAISKGKRVIIISDMYLGKETIEEILIKNGITGYDRFYLSSDLKEKKHSGKIFPLVLSDLNCRASDILHIGDNVKADVIKAKEHGLKAFHLKKSYEEFEKSHYYTSIWERDSQRHNISARSVLGIVANKLNDNPYLPDRKGTLFSGDRYKFGYAGFGVLLSGFTKWILDQSIAAEKVDDIYFLARDGKVVKEAYDILSKHFPNAPKSHYLLCSRRAVNLSKVKSFSNIKDLINVDFAKCRLGFLLENRFGLRADMLPSDTLSQHAYNWTSIIDMSHNARLIDLLKDLQSVVFSIAKEERTNYLEYLDDVGFLKGKKKLIVDIGYAGTMQESLSKLIGCNNIDGLYLMTFRKAIERISENGMSGLGYLGQFVDRHDTYHPFCRYVPLYESLFSSEDTTFIRFAKSWDKKLVPIYMEKMPSEDYRIEFVREVKEGALDLCRDMSNSLGKYIRSLDFEPAKAIRVLDSFFKNPSYIDALILSGLSFEDAYGGGGGKTILSKPEDLAKTNSIWKEGAKALREHNPNTNKNPLLEEVVSPKHEVNALFLRLSKTMLNEAKYAKLVRSPHDFFDDSSSVSSKIMKKLSGIKENS